MAPRVTGRKDASPSGPRRPAPATARPDIVVDFLVERGLLFVILKNIGSASAFHVVTRFDHPFRGLGGRKDIPGMALFRALTFVPPGKQFVQLVDPVSDYLRRREPLRLTATVAYTDRDGRKYHDAIPHNLEVYRDLGDAAIP